MSRNTAQILNELLVLRAQDGDESALAELFRDWQNRLVVYAQDLLSDREAAQDVVQESWLAILKGIRKLDDPARFKSWAYRIVHHKAMDVLRRRVKNRQVTQNSIVEEPAVPRESNEVSDVSQQLRIAIAKLKPTDRTLVRLFYIDNVPQKDICEIVGISLSALKSRLFQIRNKLRKFIERENHESRQY